MKQKNTECSVKEFSDGEAIFREGDNTKEMYVVFSGRVKICKKTSDGVIQLATLNRGDFLGEMSLLESLPRSADAVAIGETKLLCIQAGGFLVKIRRDPTFAFELLQSLSKRIRHTNDMLLKKVALNSLTKEDIQELIDQQA
ncbi:MAG: cyclic nucleotide-binding domain-containing protein [Oligoflexia bacterium]|nr:cyclic nucleotide-binding domain-containing protein [Oligoflexia bacterium]